MSRLSTILVVDDDELIGEAIQKVLSQRGYGVLRARDGLEALRIYDPRTVHLVLTDMIMPGLEGVEFVIRLKRLDPHAKIIAMSGGGKNSAEAYLGIVRHFGVAHTLVKPFGCEELLGVIQKTLSLDINNSETPKGEM
jgi:DNA-binding response OmpR family regulator